MAGGAKGGALTLGVDRREFLGAALVTAIVPAVSLVPTTAVDAAVLGPELDRDWHVDDQWSGFPRYSEPIGFGRSAEPSRPAIDPVDEQFAVF